jgi:leucyl/phenylalanyl-tRNA---protein transferase
MPVFHLPKGEIFFPPVHLAEPDGLLAIGGDLRPERLIEAYKQGIFPWYSAKEPLLWWAPDPRFALLPADLRISHSMRRVLRSGQFHISYDTAFERVIAQCASTRRRGQRGTWLVPAMRTAYTQLHALGYAHSVEVWQTDADGTQALVGGLYGVALGRVFFGESMFSVVSNASKAGFLTLVETLRAHAFSLIDCQVHTQHLESLGATEMPREHFMAHLQHALAHDTLLGPWTALR